MDFKLEADFSPTGDQPQAIEKLTKGIETGLEPQVLLGVTGSGKTYSVVNVIENVQLPTLVISHNKTLAGQLYQEFRDFFPDNAVSYFVSYYDYYQPEAYVPTTDTYISKETQINDLIEKLRLEATANVLSREDTLVVASVSCLYGLGSPEEFSRHVLRFHPGDEVDRREVLRQLVDIGYKRDDFDLQRNCFRLRGDQIDIYLSHEDKAVRLQLRTGKIEQISYFDPLTGQITQADLDQILIYPARHYLVSGELDDIFTEIRRDMQKQVKKFEKQNKLIEAQRIQERVEYDLEMIEEMGYVNGIENYSRYFDGRAPGEPPYTLIDYFNEAYGDDWLLLVDESHMTVPQIRGMYRGDKARKERLVDFGFRLPAAFDNRPLRFDEFQRRIKHSIYMSATPADWEKNQAREGGQIVEQLIRPTGIPDPEVVVRSIENQVEDLVKRIKKRVAKNQRSLVITLTKRLAEDLTDYLKKEDIKVDYLHSEIDTLERSDLLEALRRGEIDVLVGINLLREGLDLPEVTLVAILDADKEGFLRSKTSLVQIMGRAARHIEGQVILYAAEETQAIKEAVKEINRRREVQVQYNEEHDITPKSIKKPIRRRLIAKQKSAEKTLEKRVEEINSLVPSERKVLVKDLRRAMHEAAEELEFERAMQLRDIITQTDED